MDCAYCGTPLPSGALFCGECGRAVTVRATPPPTAVNDTVRITPLQLREPPAESAEPTPPSTPARPERVLDLDLPSWSSLDPASPAAQTSPRLRPQPATPARTGHDAPSDAPAVRPAVPDATPSVEREPAPSVDAVPSAEPEPASPAPAVPSVAPGPAPSADRMATAAAEAHARHAAPVPPDAPRPPLVQPPLGARPSGQLPPAHPQHAAPLPALVPPAASPAAAPASPGAVPAPAAPASPAATPARAESFEDVEATRLVSHRPAGARFVLQFSTGESVTVFGTGLLGRNPVPQPGEFFDHLVPLLDPGKSVSKTHLEFGQEGGAFWVLDRFSGNGTIVREPDAAPRRCEPGRRYVVARGARVDIGEQFFVVS